MADILKVYAAGWCPHCVKTIAHLKKLNIQFEYIDIDKADQTIVNNVIKANGGVDWVIPTLEYNGKWREGKVFNESALENDLKKLGLSI